jgi:hypothetical protein
MSFAQFIERKNALGRQFQFTKGMATYKQMTKYLETKCQMTYL